MKKLANLKGAKALSKVQQQGISGGGGGVSCNNTEDCNEALGACFVCMPGGYCLDPNPIGC